MPRGSSCCYRGIRRAGGTKPVVAAAGDDVVAYAEEACRTCRPALRFVLHRRSISLAPLVGSSFVLNSCGADERACPTPDRDQGYGGNTSGPDSCQGWRGKLADGARRTSILRWIVWISENSAESGGLQDS